MTILEAMAIAGCFVFNYFTVNKLGMVRWVNFHSMKWEKAYPVFAIKAIAIIALLIFAALLMWIYIKRRHRTKKTAGAMAAWSVLITLACVGYILFCSMQAMRSYYFICILLCTAALIQLIKTAFGLMFLRKQQEDQA